MLCLYLLSKAPYRKKNENMWKTPFVIIVVPFLFHKHCFQKTGVHGIGKGGEMDRAEHTFEFDVPQCGVGLQRLRQRARSVNPNFVDC